MRPALAIVYQTGFPADAFEEFSETLQKDHLSVHLEERQPLGPLAGVAWMMFTAAFVYIGKSYFDGILKEIGKEHYQILKIKVAELTKKTMEIPRIEPILMGTAGKVEEDDPFSMAFSVYVEMRDGSRIKLLVPKKSDNVDYSATTAVFLDFIMRCYEQGESVLEEVGATPPGRAGFNPITVAYNPLTGKIEFADPRPKQFRQE
jgi:hypothetical protein